MEILSKLTPEQLVALDKEKLELIMNHEERYMSIAKIKAFFNQITYDRIHKRLAVNCANAYKEFIESMSIIKDMKFYITIAFMEPRCFGYDYEYCTPKNIYTRDEILKMYPHPDALLVKKIAKYSVYVNGDEISSIKIEERFPQVLNYIDPIKAESYEGFLKAGIIKD